MLVAHDSFVVSDEVEKAFEQETGLELKILKAGDAGEVVTKALLTAGNPQGDVLFGVEIPAGFERSVFSEAFLGPDARNATFRDFLTAQELGIRGFPTLIAGSEAKGYALVTNGYRPLEDLLDPLERWWAAGAPVTAAAAQ